MVWYKLKLGIWNIEYSPINPLRNEYPYCDKDGNTLIKVAGKYDKGYFTNEVTGEKHEQAFRLIKGKPYAKLDKTKEVVNFREVDLKEVEDLLIEKQYLVIGDGLLRDLKNSGKAIKFGFTSGNGFKVFKAYLKPSEIYDGFLEMYLGTTQKSEVILSIIDAKKQQEKAKQIQVVVQGIDKAKIEDLIEV